MKLSQIEKRVNSILSGAPADMVKIEFVTYGNDYFLHMESPKVRGLSISFNHWSSNGPCWFEQIRKYYKSIEKYARRYNLIMQDRVFFIVLMLPEDRAELALYGKYSHASHEQYCIVDHYLRVYHGRMITNDECRRIMEKYERLYLKKLSAAEKAA